MKQSANVAGMLKVRVNGEGAALAPTAADLPLTATVVIDVPMAVNGQCAEALYPGPAPAPACALNGHATTLHCR